MERVYREAMENLINIIGDIKGRGEPRSIRDLRLLNARLSGIAPEVTRLQQAITAEVQRTARENDNTNYRFPR